MKKKKKKTKMITKDEQIQRHSIPSFLDDQRNDII